MNCYDLCCMRSHALLLKRSFKKVDHTKICNVAMPELELKPKSVYISPAVIISIYEILNIHVWHRVVISRN